MQESKQNKAGLPFTNDELTELQTSIEDITTQFDDVKSIYQASPDIIKFFISFDKPGIK